MDATLRFPQHSLQCQQHDLWRTDRLSSALPVPLVSLVFPVMSTAASHPAFALWNVLQKRNRHPDSNEPIPAWLWPHEELADVASDIVYPVAVAPTQLLSPGPKAAPMAQRQSSQGDANGVQPSGLHTASTAHTPVGSSTGLLHRHHQSRTCCTASWSAPAQRSSEHA